jgi:hypothetical protein
VLASGSAGNGSPSFPARVQVARADGALLASVQGNGERQPIYPPVDGGTHALAVRTASTATPGFFAIDLVLLPDNPREQHERENDQLSGAEPLVFTGAGRRRALLLADLAGGDFDTFRVDVTSGAQVFASCESESAGSGLLFPSASLLDASGQSLAVAALAEDGTLELGPVRVGNVDHVFLGLEAGILRDDVPVEPWMRCVVLTAP